MADTHDREPTGQTPTPPDARILALLSAETLDASVGPVLTELLGIADRQLEHMRQSFELLAQLAQALVPYHNGLDSDLAALAKVVMAHRERTVPDELEALLGRLRALAAASKRASAPLSDWQWLQIVLARLELACRTHPGSDRNALAQFAADYRLLVEFRGNLEELSAATPDMGATDDTDAGLHTIITAMATRSDLSTLMREFFDLKHQTSIARQKRQAIIEQMHQYQWSGYRIEPLEAALSQDLGTLERVFDRFERDYLQMSVLRDRLSKLDVRGFQGDLETIYLKMSDLSKVEEVQHELDTLEYKITHRK